MSIAVVVLTHDRLHLLRQCVENVVLRTSPLTREIVIWNNGSSDGTREYLDSISDPRVTVEHHPENIGVNAYAKAFPRTSSEYLVELDDDVIDAPSGWDETLLRAFERLPEVGYLAANLVDNEHDVISRVMYGPNAELYRLEEVNGIRLKVGGPIGGGCSMTSRALHDEVGGWLEQGAAFWQEDAAYLQALAAHGYRIAYLEDLKVLHAGGPFYAPTPAAKLAYWEAYSRSMRRRNVVKRLLLAIPGVRRLNARQGWFEPPRNDPDYARLYSGGTPPA